VTLKIVGALMAGSTALVYYVKSQSPLLEKPRPKPSLAVQTPVLNISQLPLKPVSPVIPSFPAPDFPGMVRPEAYDPTAKYEGLDLVIDRKTTGLVTLRVVDGNQKEIRLLYVGLLKAGQWHFQWDGKLESGEYAHPGTYQIQVLSGAETLSKQIVIKAEPDLSQK
jgi:hypothetical protein